MATGKGAAEIPSEWTQCIVVETSDGRKILERHQLYQVDCLQCTLALAFRREYGFTKRTTLCTDADADEIKKWRDAIFEAATSNGDVPRRRGHHTHLLMSFRAKKGETYFEYGLMTQYGNSCDEPSYPPGVHMDDPPDCK